MSVAALPPELDTPCLVVDVEVMDANLRAMAAHAHAAGVALRPHAKTHKCVEIARRQCALGAGGLTVATVGEAEVFADAGCLDLFIAYPLWAARSRSGRLRALAERTALRVGVDSTDGAAVLARALGGVDVEVLVEIDSGHHRTGVPPADAATVALDAAHAGLRVVGVFTFPGHGYGPERRQAAADDEARALSLAAGGLRRAGIAPDVVSGGSTPTAVLTGTPPATEIRPGVYVFNDAQQVELGVVDWSGVALSVAATVVSRRGRTLVLDAGSKVLGADHPAWVTGAGRLPDHPDARVVALSEHHATVTFPADQPTPELGSLVRVAPNHVCAAVNLADELLVSAGGAIVDSWRIAARGRNS